MKKLVLSLTFAFILGSNALIYSKDRYLVVRNPFDALEEMFHECSQEAEKALGLNWVSKGSNRMPVTNIMDEDKNLIIEMQVPGFKKDEIEVKIEPNRLTVSGKKEEKKEDKNQKYLHKESISSSFVKSVSLPVEVIIEKVTSTLQDGVLKITLPKKEISAQSKVVTIQESK